MHRGGIWLFAAITVLIGLIGVAIRYRAIVPEGGLPLPTADRAIHISIANSSTKQEWLHQAVEAFNSASPRDARWQVEDKPVLVDVMQEVIDGQHADYRSGTMISDTLEGRIKPTVLSPGDQTWIARLNNEWQALNNRTYAVLPAG